MHFYSTKKRIINAMAKILRSFNPYILSPDCICSGISLETKDFISNNTNLNIESVVGVFTSPIMGDTQEIIIFTIDGCVFFPTCDSPVFINYLRLNKAKVRRHSLTLGFYGGNTVQINSSHITDMEDFLDTILMCKLAKEEYCAHASSNKKH